MSYANQSFEETEKSSPDGIFHIMDVEKEISMKKEVQPYPSLNHIDPEKTMKSNNMAKVKKWMATQCSMGDNIWIKLIGGIILLGLSWLFLYLILKQEVLPQGGLFEILVLVVSAAVVGYIVSLVSLPPLLGMLVMGIVLKTVHFFMINGVYLDIVSTSRDVALTVILIKAGLGLDPVALRKHALTVLKLSLIPCVMEAIAAAVAAFYILEFPWLWCFLLGFLLSPISPAVVVPTLLSLKERGYGEDKGIATLVIAASSIDDIISISLFSVFLSLIFDSGGSLVMEIFHGPLELLIGIAAGIAWGLVAAFLPSRDDSMVTLKRSLMVGLGGLVLVLGSKAIKYDGSGPLACICAAFTAAIAWRAQDKDLKRHKPAAAAKRTSVAAVFSWIWLIMQPILFSFIGTEIDLTVLDWGTLAYSLAVIAICLIVRVASCFLVLLGSNLTWKERFFVNIAWLPKATVQAALSPQALELVKTYHRFEDLEKANVLLTTAILAILITAPIGSLGITLSGTRLLNKKQPRLSSETAGDDSPL